MSHRATAWVREQPLRGYRKAVLAYLAERANDDGICWPSQATIARECGISERSVRDHLAALERAGYFMRKRRYRTDGARTSDVYRLALPADSAGESVPLKVPSDGLAADPAGRPDADLPVGAAASAGRPLPLLKVHEGGAGARRDARRPPDEGDQVLEQLLDSRGIRA